MDLSKLKKVKVLEECEKRGITRCKSKTKAVLVQLIKKG